MRVCPLWTIDNRDTLRCCFECRSLISALKFTLTVQYLSDMNTLFQCLKIHNLLLGILFQQYFKKVKFEITGPSKTQKYFKFIIDMQFLMVKELKKERFMVYHCMFPKVSLFFCLSSTKWMRKIFLFKRQL